MHRTDAGTYVCVAYNGIGNSVEREIKLTVEGKPEIFVIACARWFDGLFGSSESFSAFRECNITKEKLFLSLTLSLFSQTFFSPSAFDGFSFAHSKHFLTLDPVDGSAYILGDTNSTVLTNIGQRTPLRCLAGGHPKPFVTWWRGDKILPLKDERVEITRDYSLILNKVEITDLGPYVCQGKYCCGLFYLVSGFLSLMLSREFSLQLNWSPGVGRSNT